MLVAFSHKGKVKTRVPTLNDAVSTCLCSTTMSSVASNFANCDLISSAVDVICVSLYIPMIRQIRLARADSVQLFQLFYSCPCLSQGLWFQRSFLLFLRVMLPIRNLHCPVRYQEYLLQGSTLYSS